MHETVKSFSIGVLDHFGDDHAFSRDCTDDRNLVLCASQRRFLALAGVHVLRFAADISFLNFDFAVERERIALHRSAPSVADVPASTPVSTGALAEHHAPDL